MNKTGTTFLQRDVFHPAIGDNFFRLHEFSNVELQRRKLDRQTPVVLSDERILGVTILTRQTCRNQQRHDFLFNWSVLFPHTRFVVCFRRHWEFLQSLYVQYLYLGGTLAFNRFFSLTRSAFINADELRYFPIIERICETFPGPHFFFSYDYLRDDLDGLLKQLSDFMGIGLRFTGTGRRNLSIDPCLIPALRALNFVFSSELSTRRRIPNIVFRLVAGGNTPRTLIQRLSQRYQGRFSRLFGDSVEFDTRQLIEEHYADDWRMTREYLIEKKLTGTTTEKPDFTTS